MKKIAKWMAVITLIIFIIAWGIIGFKLLNGDYDITIGAYIGAISIVVFFICVLYIKFTRRCQNCGKTIESYGKFCQHCGKEIK